MSLKKEDIVFENNQITKGRTNKELEGSLKPTVYLCELAEYYGKTPAPNGDYVNFYPNYNLKTDEFSVKYYMMSGEKEYDSELPIEEDDLDYIKNEFIKNYFGSEAEFNKYVASEKEGLEGKMDLIDEKQIVFDPDLTDGREDGEFAGYLWATDELCDMARYTGGEYDEDDYINFYPVYNVNTGEFRVDYSGQEEGEWFEGTLELDEKNKELIKSKFLDYYKELEEELGEER